MSGALPLKITRKTRQEAEAEKKPKQNKLLPTQNSTGSQINVRTCTLRRRQAVSECALSRGSSATTASESKRESLKRKHEQERTKAPRESASSSEDESAPSRWRSLCARSSRTPIARAQSHCDRCTSRGALDERVESASVLLGATMQLGRTFWLSDSRPPRSLGLVAATNKRAANCSRRAHDHDGPCCSCSCRSALD